MPAHEQAIGHDAARISARLDRLPVTRTGLGFAMLLSMGFFLELYGILSTAYIAPGLIKSGIFRMTTPGLFDTDGIGSFLGSLFFGLFIGTLFCGYLADRYGRRAVFIYGLLWFSVTNLVMAGLDRAVAIDFWRFLIGLGIGVEMLTIGTFLTEIAPRHLRGRAFALNQTLAFTSVPIVASLSYTLVPNQHLGMEGWRWIVMIGGVLGLVGFRWSFRLPESPRWLALQGRIGEAGAIMTMLEKKIARESAKPLPEPMISETPAPQLTRSTFRDLWIPP